jgi:Outer membrane protein beta-barrel domain
MKKILLLIVATFIFTAFTPSSFAQMKLGLKAGGNIANLNGSDAGNTDSKFGFAFGGFFMYQFSPLFAVQPEVYYTMKGATQKEDLGFGTINYTLSLDYIEIPVLLKLVIPVRGSNVDPAIFAGPFVGFNTTAKAKTEYNGQSQESDIQDVKSTEFGLQFGGGLGFNVGRGELGVDIRYILGLTTLDNSSANADVKNGVINFNIFYGFNLR